MQQVETMNRMETPKQIRKENTFVRTQEYFGKYKKFLIVDMTKISSKQLQLIKSDLRGKGEFLIGKNTTIRLALRKYAENNPGLKGVEDVIRSNVGIIFTNGSLGEIEDIFEARKVHSVARPGDISQCDLWIDPVFTGLDPGKTSFFHALGIVTKITKGKIEILSRCQALVNGKKVGHSEAALLELLGITPFIYKMKATHAYAFGKFFDVEHLSLTVEQVEKMLEERVSLLSSMALGAGWVTESTIEREIACSLREILAISAAAEYEV